MEQNLKLLIELGTIVFAAGILYYKVDSMDTRVRRIESIFDSIIAKSLEKGDSK